MILLQTPPWGNASDHFRNAAELDGGTVVIEAPNQDPRAPFDTGKAYVFDITSMVVNCVTSADCADDGNPCTSDMCSDGSCTHSAKANGTACGSTASTDCDNPDTCNNGTCAANYDPSGTLCTDDGNACTNDTCNGGVCTHANKAVDSPLTAQLQSNTEKRVSLERHHGVADEQRANRAACNDDNAPCVTRFLRSVGSIPACRSED